MHCLVIRLRSVDENRYKYEETPLTWVEFAQSEGGKFRPPLPLHLLLENTTINEIIVVSSGF